MTVLNNVVFLGTALYRVFKKIIFLLKFIIFYMF
jgi:hypothetical protein